MTEFFFYLPIMLTAKLYFFLLLLLISADCADVVLCFYFKVSLSSFVTNSSSSSTVFEYLVGAFFSATDTHSLIPRPGSLLVLVLRSGRYCRCHSSFFLFVSQEQQLIAQENFKRVYMKGTFDLREPWRNLTVSKKDFLIACSLFP